MKNDVVQNIRLELSKPKVRTIISVRKSDTRTRTIHVTLTMNGCVYELDNAMMAIFNAEKPDGKRCYNDCVISGNEIQYTVTTQTINVLGECKCNIEVTFMDGSVITSPEFLIMVYDKNVDETDVQSQNEYTALTQQVVQAKKYEESALMSASSAAEYASNAEASANNAETSRAETQVYVEEVWTLEENAKSYVERAEKAATEASTAEDNAVIAAKAAEVSEKNTLISEENARVSEENAEDSAKNALDAATNAEKAAENALDAATNAETSAANAVNSETSAADWAQNAKDFYEQLVTEGNLTLGTEHNTAFYGDYGQEAYDHSKVITGNPHRVTYSDVGADKSGAAQEAYQNATSYTDEKVDELINGAPTTLDTLKEIADAMEKEQSVVEALDAAIGSKANENEFSAHQANEVIHIIASERALWNAYEVRIAELEENIGYPV